MSRGGFLLAESTLFTLPSLLFAAREGAIPVRHFSFFSLYVLCHRADLFFVLSPQLFSSSARAPGPAERRTSTRHPPLSGNVLVGACRIDSRPRPQVGARRALMPNPPSMLASLQGRQVSRSYSKQQPRRLTSAAPSLLATSANLSEELARTSDATRRTSPSFWRLAHIITADGQAVVSSRRN